LHRKSNKQTNTEQSYKKNNKNRGNGERNAFNDTSKRADAGRERQRTAGEGELDKGDSEPVWQDGAEDIPLQC
jgi:hypothetical protein